MYNLKLTGNLKSKFAMHVPVIRHWKLVWERREFGERNTTIDQSFYPITLDETIHLPHGFSVTIKETPMGEAEGRWLFVGVNYQGVAVPGGNVIVKLPEAHHVAKLFDLKCRVWKGASFDLKAELIKV